MPNPSADEPASQSPPETPPQTLAQIVDKLRIKALHLRVATDPARRKLYETGAVVYEKWAERMQSVLETARHVERTTAAIN